MGTANLVQLLILLPEDFFFFFNSNSLFGFPSHLYNLPPPHHSPPAPHIHPLQNHPTRVQGMFLFQLPTTGIHLAERAPP